MGIEAGVFRVSRTAFAAGTLAAHHHERACLSVVLEGSFTEFFAGRGIDCRPGGLLVKPAGEPHRDEFAGSVQIIIEPDAGAAATLGESSDLFDRIAYHSSRIATGLAGRIARELETSDPFSRLAIEGLTLELLAGTLRAGRGASEAVRLPAWLARVRERIEDEPIAPSTAELAAIAGVHPAYLARSFRRCYGQSIGEYARRVRLEWVARMLAETHEPISAIAFSAGFADQSHLTRAFRAHWGITPRQYRLMGSDPVQPGSDPT